MAQVRGGSAVDFDPFNVRAEEVTRLDLAGGCSRIGVPMARQPRAEVGAMSGRSRTDMARLRDRCGLDTSVVRGGGGRSAAGGSR